MGEFEKIARIAKLFGRAPGEGVAVGIGDDAAVLESGGGGQIVWTIDEQIEGTHFRAEWLSWSDVGWRSFVAAASDLAAMGAAPWCALSAVGLPQGFGEAALDALAEGQRDAAESIGAPIVGGNLARGHVVSVTTTLLGKCARAVLRRGAREGDGLFIAGEAGLAAAGLLALSRGNGDDALFAAAVRAWRRPTPRIREGLAIAKSAHAAIDVSDGLAQDLLHLARASGVAMCIDEAMLLAHAGDELSRAARALGVDALDLALHGGEDYALIVSSDAPLAGFARIGSVRAGEGVTLSTRSGERPIEPRGFDHFR